LIIQDIGDLPAGGSKNHTVHMFPLKPGIHKITGFSVRAVDFTGITKVYPKQILIMTLIWLINPRYDFNNLSDVIVDHHE
jgi:hypothetical protein